jgi:hypothetical protein
VAGRREAAASYGGRSLAANMDHYNIRVNVALWLGEFGVGLSEREGFCGLLRLTTTVDEALSQILFFPSGNMSLAEEPVGSSECDASK